MSTANKLTYLNDTKQELKQKINNLGGDITDQTTFRQYADELQNVYDIFPKTSYAEGSNITLSNTLKGKLDYENGVVGIGQSSQDSTQGYQLFNPTETWSNFNGITTTITNQVMKWNGTVTTNGSKKVANISMPSGTYTISLKTISGSHISGKNIWLDFLNGTTKIGGTYFWQDGNKQVTLNGDVNIVNFGFDSGDVFNNYSFIVMIESGTTAHAWEEYTGGQASPNPSYPQEINSVTGNQDVVVSSSNVLTNATWTNGKYLNSNDEEVDNAGWKYTDYINIGQDEWMYRPSAVANAPKSLLYDVNKNKIAVLDVSNATYNLSNYNNAYYIRVSASTSSSPELYITPTSYQLSLGDIELNAIGNYKDELVYDVENDKVYKKAYIDEKILTSSMCNGVTASASYGTLCYLNFNGMVDNNVVCAMSNKFVGVSYNDRTSLPTGYRIFTSDGAGGVTLRFPNTSDIDTLQEAKDFVDNNAITVYYVLATPTLTEITDTTLINQVKALYNAHSNNGTTIITSNGNLPMIIKCRGLKGE